MNADPLWRFINERHAIYLRRRWLENGGLWPADVIASHPSLPLVGLDVPLTNDPILSTYRFCNVFRELDRVTAWIRDHWREPHRADASVLFAMAVARVINWPDTLAEIGYPWPWDPKRVYAVLRDRQARGEKVYTGAYMLRGPTGGADDNNKPHYTVFTVLQGVYDGLPLLRGHCWPDDLHGCISERDMPPLALVWDWWRQFPGWGGTGFLAYEVITDLRHTDWLCHAPDIYSWASAGPGALRGLNRLHGRPVDARVWDAVSEMHDLMTQANAPDSPLASWVPRPLEMRDIEHSLCEVDKYLRAQQGEGRPRSRYAPSSRPLALEL